MKITTTSTSSKNVFSTSFLKKEIKAKEVVVKNIKFLGKENKDVKFKKKIMKNLGVSLSKLNKIKIYV